MKNTFIIKSEKKILSHCDQIRSKFKDHVFDYDRISSGEI